MYLHSTTAFTAGLQGQVSNLSLQPAVLDPLTHHLVSFILIFSN